MIKLESIPDNWSKDQAKIYELYSDYFADSEDIINPEVIVEFEKILTRWIEESQIKIVSWNCNGKFREKFKEIIEEDADIYVIQECENPAESTDEDYREFAGDNYFWVGEIHYKGLGIFAKDTVNLEKIEGLNEKFKNFIALRVNDSFNLLGVWAMKGEKENGLNDYTEMIHDYFDANFDLFDENLVMCGDFNSNAEWDNQHKAKDNDANTTRVSEIFDNYKKVTYWYDFGDDWRFDIEIKKKIDYDKDYVTIKRFKGKYDPIEDCKGVYGLSEIVYFAENPEWGMTILKIGSNTWKNSTWNFLNWKWKEKYM